MEKLFHRRLSKVEHKQELRAAVTKVLTEEVQQEFYYHIMMAVKDLKASERHPCGGYSIAEGCLLYLLYLIENPTNAKIHQEFGIAATTYGKLVRQYSYWVRKKKVTRAKPKI
jgi:hypothetical protein